MTERITLVPLRPVPFAELVKGAPQPPSLTPADVEALTRLSYVEGPLWKIVKAGLDYCEQLAQDVAEIPLIDDAARQRARDIQVQRAAARAFLIWMVTAIRGVSPKDERKGNSDGL